MKLTTTLPYPPSANRYWRNVNGRMVKSKEARQYHWRISELLSLPVPNQTTCPLIEGSVSVTIRLFRPRRAGDLDNYLKIVLDSLNGIAWKDDKQVVELHAYRADDKKNPRVEITVTEIAA